MSTPGSIGGFADWQSGRHVDRCCLKKVVCGAGLTSYSGDGRREFAQVRYRLAASGFDDADFVEATYAGSVVRREGLEEWWPRPYHIDDAQAPIDTSADALARELEWYRRRLPATRFYLLGYSLGGVLAFEATCRLLSHDVGGWRGRLAGVAMLASPLLGVDFGFLSGLARNLATRPDFYGRAGVELVERARDPDTTDRVETQAALLRANGVRLLTVVDSNDAVVQPRDAVLPSARSAREVVVVDAAPTPDMDDVARRLGHGPVLSAAASLEAISRLVGEQECLGPHRRLSPDDQVEADLAELKARMRRQGG